MSRAQQWRGRDPPAVEGEFEYLVSDGTGRRIGWLGITGRAGMRWVGRRGGGWRAEAEEGEEGVWR